MSDEIEFFVRQVFGRDDPVPPADNLVRVSLTHTGGLSEQQILAFLAGELPVGTRVELHVRSGAR